MQIEIAAKTTIYAENWSKNPPRCFGTTVATGKSDCKPGRQ